MITLPHGLVHIWLVRPLDLIGQLKQLSSYLNDDERVRAAGYKLDAPRTQFILARGFLRRTLSGYVGAPPESLRFGTTANEKPVLLDQQIPRSHFHFNLSHTANVIALAIANDREVGVDVEQLQIRRSMGAIAKQQYHIAEQEQLAEASEEEKLSTFYRIWTCKEAYLKGLGLGFAQSLTSFAMVPCAGRVIPEPNLDSQAWSVISEIRGEYALAIAAAGDWQVEFCNT